MKTTKRSFSLLGDVALISVHPIYVAKILSGEKNLEFRRVWPNRVIEALVIYATRPEQRLAAVVEVVEVVRASKSALWQIAAAEGGGLTKNALSTYFNGKLQGVALRLGKRIDLGTDTFPEKLFGPAFRPPQSFRYLTEPERVKMRNILEG